MFFSTQEQQKQMIIYVTCKAFNSKYFFNFSQSECHGSVAEKSGKIVRTKLEHKIYRTFASVNTKSNM